MKRILVATDFSERSDRALRRATLLASQSGAALTIVHGLDDDRSPRIIESERNEMESLLRDLTSTLTNVDEVKCSWRIVLGEPSQAILTAVEDEKPDLVVLGPHRRRIFRDIFTGTTVERTIRGADCPVLMANAAPVGPYRNILLSTDFSEGSRDAMTTYLSLNLSGESRQSVLHVFDAPMLRLAMSHEISEEEREAYLEDQRSIARLELGEYLAATGLGSARVVLRHDANNLSFEILAAADLARADLIVMATHSKRGMERLLLGSTTERVLRDSEIDVLAIPPARTTGTPV
jgi:nucleotide-binding universal stress UspA family protein